MRRLGILIGLDPFLDSAVRPDLVRGKACSFGLQFFLQRFINPEDLSQLKVTHRKYYEVCTSPALYKATKHLI